MSASERRPNLILLITDQQRSPQHWPQDPGWLDELMPGDAELRRTGMNFTRAFTATAMCSPSRASMLTGTYPPSHGVELTLTEGDMWPDPRNSRAALRGAVSIARSGSVPRARLARSMVRGILRRGPLSGNEPELAPGIQTLATLLRGRGYHVAIKGKWHLTKPVAGEAWSGADPERIERDYGFSEWEPPDAGGDIKAERFGGGSAGTSGAGWDEDYTRQVEAWLARADLPEPFCLVFSLVNPHDVLGYPTSYRDGGYERGEFGDLGIELPPTVDEDLSAKPAVQALSRLGMDSYLGALPDREAELDYVNFYAHLHRVVDEKITRLLGALGSAQDPASLRSRTVIVRTSDHGELGLSHGGLRQKVFNAYEESIRVPFVVSSPALFPQPRESDALVSLVDVVPTMLGLSGAQELPAHLDGRDLGPLLAGSQESVRDAVLFTYDDHQAGTALQDGPGQPNRIRCVRDGRWKYAAYIDPARRAPAEFEMYDLLIDPNEHENLLDRASGAVLDAQHEQQRASLAARLAQLCAQVGAQVPPAPA